MTDEDLMARIKFVVDNLSFKIGDLTLMYEHKQVDPDDFYKEARCKTAGGQMGYSKCYKDGKEI